MVGDIVSNPVGCQQHGVKIFGSKTTGLFEPEKAVSGLFSALFHSVLVGYFVARGLGKTIADEIRSYTHTTRHLRAGLVKRIGDYPLWDAVWL